MLSWKQNLIMIGYNKIEMDQISTIKNKLERLKNLDKAFSVFGSSKHQYILGSKVKSTSIKDFEKKYNIILPSGFKTFLQEIGNGGAGPYYGLEPIENILFTDLDYKTGKLNPSEPFQFTQKWNMDFTPSVSEEKNQEKYEEELEQFEQFYFSPRQMNGAISICNFGCGISLNLIVNGEEYGNIWTDDRGNDGGIYPSIELGNPNRINFLEWYELWLNQSIKKAYLNKLTNGANSSPWWKFW